MTHILLNSIGIAAGLCSIASFVPQVIKILRERQAEGVSLKMFAVTAAAFALWATYGALQRSWPLLISNTLCLALVITIVVLRLRFGD